MEPVIVLKSIETGLYFVGWRWSQRAFSGNTVTVVWDADVARAKRYHSLGAMERTRALLGNVRPVGVREAR